VQGVTGVVRTAACIDATLARVAQVTYMAHVEYAFRQLGCEATRALFENCRTPSTWTQVHTRHRLRTAARATRAMPGATLKTSASKAPSLPRVLRVRAIPEQCTLRTPACAQ
jgi:hypothetical protein